MAKVSIKSEKITPFGGIKDTISPIFFGYRIQNTVLLNEQFTFTIILYYIIYNII